MRMRIMGTNQIRYIPVVFTIALSLPLHLERNARNTCTHTAHFLDQEKDSSGKDYC